MPEEEARGQVSMCKRSLRFPEINVGEETSQRGLGEELVKLLAMTLVDITKWTHSQCQSRESTGSDRITHAGLGRSLKII